MSSMWIRVCALCGASWEVNTWRCPRSCQVCKRNRDEAVTLPGRAFQKQPNKRFYTGDWSALVLLWDENDRSWRWVRKIPGRRGIYNYRS